VLPSPHKIIQALSLYLDNWIISDKIEDMLLTVREYCVLRQLLGQEKYGLEIVADSDGLIKRGSAYVLLGRMEAKGLIEGREEPPPPGRSGPPRRVYKITGGGARTLAAHEAGQAILFPKFAGEVQ
jgi:DNA-binding PadR family transcriptional regulator